MRLFAHRGCMDQFPENTLSALESVSPHVDGVEIDVRRCATGELVVIHDETLDRVTTTTGRVDEMPLERLREVDVLGTGQGVPLLDEALAVVPDDVAVNVELKESETAADAQRIAQAHDNHVIVSSFDSGALHTVVGEGAGSVAYLFYDLEGEPLRTAATVGCEYVHPHLDLCTPDFVETAHDRGFEVNAWTVETEAEASRLAAAGVDGVISNRLDVL